jgi:hypothetical protein
VVLVCNEEEEDAPVTLSDEDNKGKRLGDKAALVEVSFRSELQ